MTNEPKPLFELGALVATPGALDALDLVDLYILISLHASGDWGCLDEEDKERNSEALKLGSRILSAYPVDPALPCLGHGPNCVWIITEADRSVTTILLPSEY